MAPKGRESVAKFSHPDDVIEGWNLAGENTNTIM